MIHALLSIESLISLSRLFPLIGCSSIRSKPTHLTMHLAEFSGGQTRILKRPSHKGRPNDGIFQSAYLLKFLGKNVVQAVACHIRSSCIVMSAQSTTTFRWRTTMTSRLNPVASHFDLVKPLIDYGNFCQEGLDPTLAELIKIRASQINGCGQCLFFHMNDARKNGESEERIIMLAAWHESPLFNERERAALAWTEALTMVHRAGAPDDVYETLKAHFSGEEQIKITLLIGAINAFNRLNVGFRIRHPASAGRKAA
jgi:AhpD family alkylhydroperoxidase